MEKKEENKDLNENGHSTNKKKISMLRITNFFLSVQSGREARVGAMHYGFKILLLAYAPKLRLHNVVLCNMLTAHRTNSHACFISTLCKVAHHPPTANAPQTRPARKPNSKIFQPPCKAPTLA